MQKNIKLLVMDVDGVLTDGSIYVGAQAELFKRFNSKDGMGVVLAHRHHITTAILSAGQSPKIVQHRARMLGIDRVYVGQTPKIEILKNWVEELQLDPAQVAYIGDDITDMECLGYVGLSACPADAVDVVKNSVRLVLDKKGGHGCLREFVEFILQRQK